MKKIITIFALTLLVATQASAADNVATDFADAGKTVYGATSGVTADATTGVLIGKNSTGVALGAKTGAAGYAMLTQHKSGNRAFGTAFDSTSVYYKEVTVGAAEAEPSATDSAEFADWTSM